MQYISSSQQLNNAGTLANGLCVATRPCWSICVNLIDDLELSI